MKCRENVFLFEKRFNFDYFVDKETIMLDRIRLRIEEYMFQIINQYEFFEIMCLPKWHERNIFKNISIDKKNIFCFRGGVLLIERYILMNLDDFFRVTKTFFDSNNIGQVQTHANEVIKSLKKYNVKKRQRFSLKDDVQVIFLSIIKYLYYKASRYELYNKQLNICF